MDNLQDYAKMGIPVDQINLLFPYTRDLKSMVSDYCKTKTGKIPVKNFISLLSQANQTLAEPRNKELNRLYYDLAIRKSSLTQISKEMKELMDRCDIPGHRQIYALLTLSVCQFFGFYYTIFQVDWLGWDIMEPITYSLELISMLITMRYYLKYRASKSLDHIMEVKRTRLVAKSPSTMVRYRTLKKHQDALEQEVKYLQKAIYYHEARQKLLS